jgi:hypothetical protein
MIVVSSFYRKRLERVEKQLEEQMNNKKHRDRHEGNMHEFHRIDLQMRLMG